MLTKHSKHFIFFSILGLVILIISACGAAQPETITVVETVIVEKEVEVIKEVEVEKDVEVELVSDNGGEINNSNPTTNQSSVSNRMIIKSGELHLLVENTDYAINQTIGIVTEYQGYIVSNRTWFSNEEKYATISIGVPVVEFEKMMRRLKDLAIRVEDEVISGQDVTDEFVDLGSRLKNLETTAARIREFMAQAKNVEESLEVSAQLSEIEGQIEQVKGRMNYLKDRAAFSTITLEIRPQVIVPTPAPTPWSPVHTFNDATEVTSEAATSTFQFLVDSTIWIVVVILPFVLPIIILMWLGVRVLRWAGRKVVTN